MMMMLMTKTGYMEQKFANDREEPKTDLNISYLYYQYYHRRVSNN